MESQKTKALEIELKQLIEAEAYSIRAINLGFKIQKDNIKEMLKESKGFCDMDYNEK